MPTSGVLIFSECVMSINREAINEVFLSWYQGCIFSIDPTDSVPLPYKWNGFLLVWRPWATTLKDFFHLAYLFIYFIIIGH